MILQEHLAGFMQSVESPCGAHRAASRPMLCPAMSSNYRSLRVLLAAAVLLVVGAAFAKAQITDGPPPKAKPSEAGWGFYKGWASGWTGLHQK